MNIINLTPHEINICDNSGTTVRTIPASGEVARLVEMRYEAPTIDGIAVSHMKFDRVVGLPDRQPDTIYIVSAMVMNSAWTREDVFAPGPAVRDDAGRIIGCIGLSCTPMYFEPSNRE